MPVPERWAGVRGSVGLDLLARHAAWRDEQAEIPSSSSRPREENIQSGVSQLRMTCSDDEDVSAEESSSAQGILRPPKEHPSVKKFHDMQKEKSFPPAFPHRQGL